MSDETSAVLADSLKKLSCVLERQGRLLELLVESIPATKEAEILGISEKTVRRRRARRAAERLLESV